MEADEAGTLARLRTHRIELIEPVIAKNQGNIIKTTGDGMLVQFQSVADAVRCAAEVQTRMRRRNTDVPERGRIQFRMGINLGDIFFDEGDIYGDGVNVAARLEQMADAGGICITQAVYEQVSDRVDVSFEDLGEKSLKNISRPVRVWRAMLEDGAPHAGADAGSARRPVVKPSIAVMPFANMSGDAEQEYFVDGLTEDIITELSRRHELFVISRNSTFVYKGQSVNIREVAEKLGAQYVMEGSVRRSGEHLRVNAQLIDTSNDAHVWAERYDRKLDDVFAIQDELTAAIVATLPGRVEAAQHDLLARKTPASLAAYECVLAAKVRHHRSDRAENAEALKLITRALELDPDYAHAHAWRGCILGQSWIYGWCADREATYNEIIRELEIARNLDENDADVHRILAASYITRNDLERARYHQERAFSLNPNYDLVVVQQGELLTWLGSPKEGIEWIRKAMRLNPHHPERFWSHLGKAHFTAQEYAEAVEAFMHLSRMDAGQHAFVAATYALLRDRTAAAAHYSQMTKLDPGLTIDGLFATLHYANDADLEQLREGLAIAEAAHAETAGTQSSGVSVAQEPEPVGVARTPMPPESC